MLKARLCFFSPPPLHTPSYMIVTLEEKRIYDKIVHVIIQLDKKLPNV